MSAMREDMRCINRSNDGGKVFVQNWFAIETEAEYRRQEWARAVAADTKAAAAQADRAERRWPRLPSIAMFRLNWKRRALPRWPLAKPIEMTLLQAE
jgi:hypothetical protein